MCCTCRAYGDVAFDGELRGGDAESGGGRCQNDAAALRLREVPIAAILVARVLGVSLPLTGGCVMRFAQPEQRSWRPRHSRPRSSSSRFVHMLHDVQHTLSSPFLPADEDADAEEGALHAQQLQARLSE